jgi:mitosis inhibitor protein kinase SWE1
MILLTSITLQYDPGYGSSESPTTRRTPSSSSSSSEAGSPLSRPRTNSCLGRGTRINPTKSQVSSQRRAPIQRLESAATLFFGPAIKTSTEKTRTNAPVKSVSVARLRPERLHTNRHSYAGPSSKILTDAKVNAKQRSESPSPPDEDEDMFFGSSANSSFMFSVTEGTPSPRSKRKNGGLQKKFKPRDSGVALTDDEEAREAAGDGGEGYLGVCMGGRGSSTSVSTEGDGEALVTPGVGPGVGSGWPETVIVNGNGCDETGHGVGGYEGGDVDSFILRTLAAGAKGPEGGGKKIPGTPVKKVKMIDVVGGRPWQSAVTKKVGGAEFEFVGKVPRKSLPAAFTGLRQGQKGRDLGPGGDETDEEGEDSPSSRKEKERYAGLGMGKPSVRTRWLMRRSSSGAFSSGSENSGSVAGTPTRFKGRG